MNTLQLSEMAQMLIDYMCSNYVEKGYLMSGSVDEFQLRYMLGSHDVVRSVLDELIQAGLIQVRNSLSVTYELTLTIRRELIVKHELSSKWGQDPTAMMFKPNAPTGEVTSVMLYA